MAVENGEPCPYCGLSASAIEEVNRAQDSRANEEMQAKYSEAVIRADKAEREARSLRNQLDRIRRAVTSEGGE